MRLLVLWLGKVLLVAARMRGGGGSAFPGLVVEKFRPGLLAEQVARLPGGCVVITGTNGKTTTAKMLTGILGASGQRVITNQSGSNMLRGLLSSVIEQSSWTGRLDADRAVFEVDEPNLPQVARILEPGVVLVLNLGRDQLDRYGELEHTAELVGDGLPHAGSAVLNADDPLVASLSDRVAGDVRWFGASDEVRAQLPDDAGLLAGASTSGPAVGLEDLDVALLTAVEAGSGQELELRVGGEHHDAHLALPGIYNAYNAAAALAVAGSLGVEAQVATRALAEVEAAFGRGERIAVGQAEVVLLLVKNPSSFTQVIRTQLGQGPDRSVLLALNDNFADGRDVSWIWDVDIEAMRGRSDRILVTGIRAHDLALRLKYAGIEAEVEPDSARALDRFLGMLQPGETGFIVPTYTAMLDLRRKLSHAAPVKEFWR